MHDTMKDDHFFECSPPPAFDIIILIILVILISLILTSHNQCHVAYTDRGMLSSYAAVGVKLRGYCVEE
jgi:hypothetical protein